ncbi:hypothetical protein Pmani_036253 [Petrolisthes manimaculis]|uniref:Kinetochore protein SPC25 n=1 Tax=Petrolisthes manimaculis TaxID=1843537 RepID=A0AAE1TPK2_9EUCA|nr:hypothetical protein Pmani_037149 [Petrolisthes manimaculis]KAK4290869.1 hypothetical protein Pmani_036253 [Petrolisthes manimaculis]
MTDNSIPGSHQTSMSAELGITMDFDQELETFTHSLTSNKTALQRVLAQTLSDFSNLGQMYVDDINKDKDTARELKQKIEGVRKKIGNIHGDNNCGEEELNEIRQKLEKVIDSFQEKDREKDKLNQKLTEVLNQLAEKEEKVGQMELKNQEVQNQGKKGLDLYRENLGLTITRTSRKTVLFTFTQVSRSSPETEYMLELSLDGEQYQLLGSNPPLPDLPRIQDRLNATNNLSGCVAYVRASFQKMAQVE